MHVRQQYMMFMILKMRRTDPWSDGTFKYHIMNKASDSIFWMHEKPYIVGKFRGRKFYRISRFCSYSCFLHEIGGGVGGGVISFGSNTSEQFGNFSASKVSRYIRTLAQQMRPDNCWSMSCMSCIFLWMAHIGWLVGDNTIDNHMCGAVFT